VFVLTTSSLCVPVFGVELSEHLWIEWANKAGRYEGATAEKAVPFPSCRPSILISISLRDELFDRDKRCREAGVPSKESNHKGMADFLVPDYQGFIGAKKHLVLGLLSNAGQGSNSLGTGL